MGVVKIKIVATADHDYSVQHLMGIDDPTLSEWKIIGTGAKSFTYEVTQTLRPGNHQIAYCNLGYGANDAWHAQIYINNKIVAESGDNVSVNNPLVAKLIVGLFLVWPIPSPLMSGRRYMVPVVIASEKKNIPETAISVTALS